MSTRVRLTDEDVVAIGRAKAAGASVAELATRYGVTPAAIYHRLKAAGAPATSTRRRGTAAEDQRPYPEYGKGYVPLTCAEPRCGQGPERGRATLRLVVYGAEQEAVEFCSWHCLSRHAIRLELAGGDA